MEIVKIRRLLSLTRRAVDEYGMIADGDKIAVGLSGGKDSLALLCALSELRRFYPIKFELSAISIDMGFPDMDFTPLIRFCADLAVDYTVVPTKISEVVFDIRRESNPCSLCSRMRRGALHDAVVANGAAKLALGHHFDDSVETFMLNLLNEGRLGSFSPVTYLSRKDITMIRPLIYVQEKDIQHFISQNSHLPVIHNPCPADKNTERERIKHLLEVLNRDNKGLKNRIFGAICRAGLDGYRSDGSDG